MFNMKRYRTIPVMIMVCSLVGTASAASVVITPSLDTSIYSESDNSNAQGFLFAGRTNAGGIRRAMIQFDVLGGGIPAGSVINSVSLTLVQTKSGGSAGQTFELVPVSKAWGEGTSLPLSAGGQGALPTAGDATWNFQVFNATPTSWTNPGGDVGGASGSASLGVSNQAYTFTSQAGMVADVQQWLDTPSSNFGWMLRAVTESSVTSAREFGSSELGTKPTLTIDYTAVPEPGVLGLLGSLACLRLISRRRA
jgi:hypothetical protein